MILIDINEYTGGKYRIPAQIPGAGNFKASKLQKELNGRGILGVFNTYKNVYPAGNANTTFFLRDTKSNSKYDADIVFSRRTCISIWNLRKTGRLYTG